jgi:hypothetical protein
MGQVHALSYNGADFLFGPGPGGPVPTRYINEQMEINKFFEEIGMHGAAIFFSLVFIVSDSRCWVAIFMRVS